MLDKDLIIFDVETSGKDPRTCSIIQLGAVQFLKTGHLTSERFSIHIKPYTSVWEEEAQKIHKISETWLSRVGFDLGMGLIAFQNWIEKLGYECKDFYLAMWSNGFDTECLKKAYNYCGKYPFNYKSYDIASFVRLYLGGYGMLPMKKPSLVKCCNILNVIPFTPSHDALVDAINTAKLLQFVYNKIRLSRNKDELDKSILNRV